MKGAEPGKSCWERRVKTFVNVIAHEADELAEEWMNHMEREGWSVEHQQHWFDRIRITVRRSRARRQALGEPQISEDGEPVVG